MSSPPLQQVTISAPTPLIIQYFRREYIVTQTPRGFRGIMKTVVDTARFENHFLLFHHATDVDIDKIASEHGDGMRKYLVKVTATLDDVFKLERFMQTNLECVFEQQGSDEPVDRPKKLGMFHASKSPQEVHSDGSSGAESMSALSHTSGVTPEEDIVNVNRRVIELPQEFLKLMLEQISSNNENHNKNGRPSELQEQRDSTSISEQQEDRMREVAQMARLARRATPSLLSETEAADFNTRIPEKARIGLYITNVVDIKRNQDGTPDPSNADLTDFAAAVKALLEQHLPEKYKPRAQQ